MLRTPNLLILDPSTLSAAPKMADALMDMHRQCSRRLTAARKKNRNNNNNNSINKTHNLTRFHLLNLLIYHTIQVVRFYSFEKSSHRLNVTVNSASLIFGSFMISIHTTPDIQSP